MTESPPSISPPKKLFTFKSGGWVLLLAVFFTLVAASFVVVPLFETGFERAVGDGAHVDSYGFDLSNLTVPKDHLAATGMPKDGIRSISEKLVESITPEEVDLIAKNEHIRFLVPSDRVIGVKIDNETRAYPVRVLNYHEIVNDVLGGVPIVVTWSPLCDSAVVFDRRIDGTTLEFGASGLLLGSNLVMFNRHTDPKQESLWPQLTFHAISGSAANKPLKLIPYQLATWKDWREAHPDTRVLLGLRTMKTQYSQDPYSTYIANDDLKFPVYPLWTREGVARKTRIIATSTDQVHWKVSLDNSPPTATSQPANTDVIHAFIFAWYAQHRDDSDYSAIH